MTAKIPATVITGFLGAGKTTLIRHMLENAGGRRIALIINEFGDLGVDGGLLKGCGIENCRDEDVIELNNGCICCTVADDFIPTMQMLLGRAEKPDHIVIETSGLALPQPLVAAFNWPDIRTQVTVDGVITVVDAAAVAEGRFADDEDAIAAQRAADDALDHEGPLEELFEDQLIAADMVVLNKADLIDSATLERVRTEVSAHARKAVRTVTSQMGRLPIDVLLGLGVGTEDDIANRRSHHEMDHEGQDGAHEHDHDEFESFVVSLGAIGDPAGFAERLKGVIATHDVLRIKGFIAVPEKPMRLVLQAVGGRIAHHFDRPWGDMEARETRLVVIGLHDTMDDIAVRADIEAAARAAA